MGVTNINNQTGALMADTNSTPFITRRSVPVRIIKSLLSSARVFAPRWLYDGVYRIGFGLWKSALRFLYQRKIVVAWLTRDRQQLQLYKTVHQAMEYSLVGSSGLEATYRAAKELLDENIEGCFVECGVAQGGCSALMATVAKADDRRITWLFDSFEGLPDPTERDFVDARGNTGENVRPLERGSCLGTLQRVEDVLFRHFGLRRSNVRMVQGWFQDTLPVHRDKLGPIAMLRLDGDWYESTKCCLENLFDRLSPGGYCIADDYGTFYGCRKAVDEFIQARGLTIQAFSDGRGGYLFRKPYMAKAAAVELSFGSPVIR
jgi:hypothetical protein